MQKYNDYPDSPSFFTQLLTHISNRSNHGGDSAHADSHIHHFGGTHLALQLGWDDNLAAWLHFGTMREFGYLAIHVDDVCLAL